MILRVHELQNVYSHRQPEQAGARQEILIPLFVYQIIFIGAKTPIIHSHSHQQTVLS